MKTCEAYIDCFEGALCGKPTEKQYLFRNKNDHDKTSKIPQCEEHARFCNPYWECTGEEPAG